GRIDAAELGRHENAPAEGRHLRIRNSEFGIWNWRARAMSRPGASALWLLSIVVILTVVVQGFPANQVTVTPKESARRVDVTIGGKPFTSYLWDEHLRKPVLYPLRSANG